LASNRCKPQPRGEFAVPARNPGTWWLRCLRPSPGYPLPSRPLHLTAVSPAITYSSPAARSAAEIGQPAAPAGPSSPSERTFRRRGGVALLYGALSRTRPEAVNSHVGGWPRPLWPAAPPISQLESPHRPPSQAETDRRPLGCQRWTRPVGSSAAPCPVPWSGSGALAR
jgi:hypothetical protein